MGIDIDTDIRFKPEKYEYDDPHENPPEINPYYKKLEDNVKMLLKGIGNFVLIDAKGGIGKTYNIKRILSENLSEENYTVESGKTTPLELYKTLWKTQGRGHVLFLDDLSGLTSGTSMELLKAATDTSEPRKVAYNSSRKPDHPFKPNQKIETEIIYRGKIIMCANDVPDDNANFEALKSRATSFYEMDHDFDYETICQVMREIAKLSGHIEDEHGNSLTVREQQECAEWIIDLTSEEMPVNLRTLEHVCNKRLYGKLHDADWLSIALPDLGYYNEDMYLVKRLKEEGYEWKEAEEYFIEETGKSEGTFNNYWVKV